MYRQQQASVMLMVGLLAAVALMVHAKASTQTIERRHAEAPTVQDVNDERQANIEQHPDTLPLNAAGSSSSDFFVDGGFLNAVNCDATEELTHGKELTCEQTCSNPRPICTRVFIYDRPFCFCKKGLFRHEASKKCVTWEQCSSAHNNQ